MLISWSTRMFAAALLFACIAAWMRGGSRERIGAVMFIAAWAGSVGSQFLEVGYTPLAELAAIDSALFLGLVWLAWKSPRSWPVIAAGLQAVALSLHAAFALKFDLNARAYITALNLIGYAQLGALAWASLTMPSKVGKADKPTA